VREQPKSFGCSRQEGAEERWLTAKLCADGNSWPHQRAADDSKGADDDSSPLRRADGDSKGADDDRCR
jgi:hypothetical protein